MREERKVQENWIIPRKSGYKFSKEHHPLPSLLHSSISSHTINSCSNSGAMLWNKSFGNWNKMSAMEVARRVQRNRRIVHYRGNENGGGPKQPRAINRNRWKRHNRPERFSESKRWKSAKAVWVPRDRGSLKSMSVVSRATMRKKKKGKKRRIACIIKKKKLSLWYGILSPANNEIYRECARFV